MKSKKMVEWGGERAGRSSRGQKISGTGEMRKARGLERTMLDRSCGTPGVMKEKARMGEARRGGADA